MKGNSLTVYDGRTYTKTTLRAEQRPTQVTFFYQQFLFRLLPLLSCPSFACLSLSLLFLAVGSASFQSLSSSQYKTGTSFYWTKSNMFKSLLSRWMELHFVSLVTVGNIPPRSARPPGSSHPTQNRAQNRSSKPAVCDALCGLTQSIKVIIFYILIGCRHVKFNCSSLVVNIKVVNDGRKASHVVVISVMPCERTVTQLH